jgi:hypothetical protein
VLKIIRATHNRTLLEAALRRRRCDPLIDELAREDLWGICFWRGHRDSMEHNGMPPFIRIKCGTLSIIGEAEEWTNGRPYGITMAGQKLGCAYVCGRVEG